MEKFDGTVNNGINGLPSREMWGNMYAEFRDKLVASLSRYYSLQDREDAVEEAFHKLMYKKLAESYGNAMPSSAEEWYGNLRWQAKAWLSHQKGRLGVHAKYVDWLVKEIEDSVLPDTRTYTLTDEDHREAIVRCVRKALRDQDVSYRDVRIFMALAVGLHSTDEIAARYNIKPNHVYQIKFRVKNALAYAFKEANYRLVA